MDQWKHRSYSMKCKTCYWYVKKERYIQEIRPENIHVCDAASEPEIAIGRCRRHAPTINGYPIVYENDWCGDHRLDENK